MRAFVLSLLTVLCVLSADRLSAQPAANTVPKYDGSGTLIGSTIVDVGGFVGIGTTNPGDFLQVGGGVTVQPTAPAWAALRLVGTRVVLTEISAAFN